MWASYGFYSGWQQRKCYVLQQIHKYSIIFTLYIWECDNKPSNFLEKHTMLQRIYFTSICILRCVLKWESRVRKMESESSKTSGTEETPFLDRATHRYCLMALMNISLVLKMGPAFCRMDRSSWRDKTFDRSSWDLRKKRGGSWREDSI